MPVLAPEVRNPAGLWHVARGMGELPFLRDTRSDANPANPRQSPNPAHQENDKLSTTKMPADAASPSLLTCTNSFSFITLISDSLRLRDETLAMAFVYINKYLSFLRDTPDAEELLDDYVRSIFLLPSSVLCLRGSLRHRLCH